MLFINYVFFVWIPILKKRQTLLPNNELNSRRIGIVSIPSIPPPNIVQIPRVNLNGAKRAEEPWVNLHEAKRAEETNQPPSYDQVVLHDIIAQSQQDIEEPPTYFESQGHM